MSLRETLIPTTKKLSPGLPPMSLEWSAFFQKLQKVKVLGPTAKLNPATATNADIVNKLNELIQLLRDNKFIDGDTSGDP
jgi:hypothetical protein